MQYTAEHITLLLMITDPKFIASPDQIKIRQASTDRAWRALWNWLLSPEASPEGTTDDVVDLDSSYEPPSDDQGP